ncbi:GlxA family transcriptional regulator [Umezawaea beigongshangensis]|uniref:GlxA family transcriptional regulator n=1 Tax=Umezawaea beigongshangensis TaxID=2780383 RepID=UPI0018F26E3C|nr:helix-turn-helix domain-containing protein [Umezawaea beigongshangensis]
MRTVGVLILPGTRTFDVAVASEVWGVDRADAGIGPFELRLCSAGRRSLPLHPVGSLPATHGLSGLAGCDLVVVPGRADPHAPVPPGAVRALRSAHAAGATVAALCSGAFVLAAAGLLDGRAATTHWRLLDALRATAPAALVRPDVLFTSDGSVHTSAGVLGGADLCLHLVRRALGADVAAALARRLVMPPAREGGQRQYVEAPVPARPDRPGVAATVDWAVPRLAEPIGVDDLAGHSGLSERTFHRAFLAATGSTPGRWLRVQRVRLAQRLLETTDLPVHRVAERSGLGTPANLRRRLRAELGVTPDAYRRTFRVPEHPAAVASPV